MCSGSEAERICRKWVIRRKTATSRRSRGQWMNFAFGNKAAKRPSSGHRSRAANLLVLARAKNGMDEPPAGASQRLKADARCSGDGTRTCAGSSARTDCSSCTGRAAISGGNPYRADNSCAGVHAVELET
jgi:hypothetical protein